MPYDARGRLARVTNPRGQALVHVYEPFGGLAEVRHYPTAADADAGTNLARTVSYAYDASGNLTETGDTDYSSSAPTLETTVYDELDRPQLVTVHYVPGGDRTLESGYDRYGNRKSFVFTDGSEVLTHTWTYNKLNRLVEADLASPNPLAFTYYANDDLETITHGNGVTTEYTYFPEGPIESIRVESTTEQLLALTYGVDKVLNITGVTEQHEASGTSHLYSYGYDALDRLTSATYPTALGLPASEAFAYDDAGNREDPADPSAYAYDANNRITASPGKAWVYDGDGNSVSVNAGLASEQTFAHDTQSRMRGYENAASSTTASYLYDPFARRMKKTVSGATTWFLWDGDHLLAEFDGSGARDRRYTYTGEFAPAEQVIAGGSGENVQPVHTDHLDTPRSISDQGGDPVWRGAHRAFGTTMADEDPDGDLVDVRFLIRFPGQFEDAESGRHDNRFRYFDPTTGRYLSRDPIPILTGFNAFQYANASPLRLFDSLGLFTNLGDDVVWVRPEDSDRAYPIEPGEPYPYPIEGLAFPGRCGHVYKTGDCIKVFVTSGQPISWETDRHCSRLMRALAWINQVWKGGWLSKPPDRYWNALFEAVKCPTDCPPPDYQPSVLHYPVSPP